MAEETISTNMGMPIPGVGQTAGPTWASDLNTSLSIIDAHDHTTGNGVPITPGGLNINATLSFNTNAASDLLKAVFTSQSAALTGNNFLSFVGGNLYVNDSSGNQIQMTSAGGVAGTPGSIGSLASPAAATYSAGNKTFTWTSGSTKAAAMDNGAITIRETNVAAAKGVTIQSPGSLAADYSLTLLAALPGTTQVLNCTSAGSLGTISYDSIGSSMSATGANAIANTRTRAVTTNGSNPGSGGIAFSTSTGSYSTSSSTYVNITNASVTLTTTGRPVRIELQSDGSSTSSNINIAVSGTQIVARFNLTGAGGTRSVLETDFSSIISGNGTNSLSQSIPSTSISFMDNPVAGTYTYTLQTKIASSVGSGPLISVSNCSLVAYEL